jgi:cellulose synthase/poly-beta-1,6-N-acetylglucosamine synthase-like glycosyltransferase
LIIVIPSSASRLPSHLAFLKHHKNRSLSPKELLILLLSLPLNQNSMILEILWMVFFASTAIQFIYLLFIFGRLAFFYESTFPSPSKEEGVSILVAARNEERNLRSLIPILAAQDYPKFEIIIVNDRSSDDTQDLLRGMMNIYPQLRTVTILYTPEHVTAKKYALTLGIKVAKYDIILLTDADCTPASNKWVKMMSAPLMEDSKIFALGHGAYATFPGFLNRLIQYETLFTAINYFSFALWKSPIMGVGRNLCYRRSFFLEKKAFKGLWNINGGDDDLLINRYANGNNTAVVIHPDSMTHSQPKTDWKSYFDQKRRHFHAGKYYQLKNKLKLGVYLFTHLIFWISGCFLLWGSKSWEPIAVVAGLIILRAFVQLKVFMGAKKKLEGIGKVYWTMFFDLVYLGYFWVVGTKGYLSKKIKWK